MTTSKKVASKAGRELRTQTTKVEKAVAASDLGQANKKTTGKKSR